MKLLIPDPYTTSLAVAMYYAPPIQNNNRVQYLIAMAEKEKKNPQRKVQPTENIGRNVDVYA